MKGRIPFLQSVCTTCIYGMVMEQPTERVIHCQIVKRTVLGNIIRCSTLIPRGQTDPLWGGDAYAKGIPLDLRPETGQAL